MDKPMCAEPGCDRRGNARSGYCDRCYQRHRRAGTLPPSPTPDERFDAKWELDPLTGCHIWTAYRMRDGYGVFGAPGRRTELAHRWAWQRTHGEIPVGMHLDHFACDNPPCVNPDHMRVVTPRENLLRGNGMAARNLAKTHCLRGHPLTPDNLRKSDKGYRFCATCARAAEAAYRARRRDASH